MKRATTLSTKTSGGPLPVILGKKMSNYKALALMLHCFQYSFITRTSSASLLKVRENGQSRKTQGHTFSEVWQTENLLDLNQVLPFVSV